MAYNPAVNPDYVPPYAPAAGQPVYGQPMYPQMPSMAPLHNYYPGSRIYTTAKEIAELRTLDQEALKRKLPESYDSKFNASITAFLASIHRYTQRKLGKMEVPPPSSRESSSTCLDCLVSFFQAMKGPDTVIAVGNFSRRETHVHHHHYQGSREDSDRDRNNSNVALAIIGGIGLLILGAIGVYKSSQDLGRVILKGYNIQQIRQMKEELDQIAQYENGMNNPHFVRIYRVANQTLAMLETERSYRIKSTIAKVCWAAGALITATGCFLSAAAATTAITATVITGGAVLLAAGVIAGLALWGLHKYTVTKPNEGRAQSIETDLIHLKAVDNRFVNMPEFIEPPAPEFLFTPTPSAPPLYQ